MQSQKPVHITDLITPSHNRPHKGRLVSINEGYIIDWNCIVIVWLLCGYCVVRAGRRRVGRRTPSPT